MYLNVKNKCIPKEMGSKSAWTPRYRRRISLGIWNTVHDVRSLLWVLNYRSRNIHNTVIISQMEHTKGPDLCKSQQGNNKIGNTERKGILPLDIF